MTDKILKTSKVPNLRFTGFEDNWEEMTLGTCSNSLDYGMNASACEFDGLNKYIRITDIDESSSRYKSESPVSPTGELVDKYLVEENDILFARTGASTGKTYLYNPKDGKLYFAGFLIRAKIKKTYNSYFIFAQTQTVAYNKWVKVMSMRSGQPGINSQEFASYSFYIPTKLEEQNKIASLLLLIDLRIQTQNEIIQRLETSIQGIRKKIFKQKIKFKDENGNEFSKWEKCRLSDIANRIITKNKIDNQNVLTISAQFGLISQLEYFKKSVSAKNLTGYYLLEKNDFAYNKSYSSGYPMGAIKRLNLYDLGVVSTLYICFRFNKKVSLDFMEQYFECGSQNKELEKVAQEGARNHGLLNIGVNDFFDIYLKIPCLEEQKKIAALLCLIDKKLEIETNILKHLTTQKQYLLQQLFI